MPLYQLLTELPGLAHVQVSHNRLQGPDRIELTIPTQIPADSIFGLFRPPPGPP